MKWNVQRKKILKGVIVPIPVQIMGDAVIVWYITETGVKFRRAFFLLRQKQHMTAVLKNYIRIKNNY